MRRTIMAAAAVALCASAPASANQFRADGAYAGPRTGGYSARSVYGPYVPKLYRPGRGFRDGRAGLGAKGIGRKGYGRSGGYGLRGPFDFVGPGLGRFGSPSFLDLPGIDKPTTNIESNTTVNTTNRSVGDVNLGDEGARSSRTPMDDWAIRESIAAQEMMGLGTAAAGGSQVAEGIMLRRERRKMSVESGSRILSVTDDMKILDEERTFIRDSQGRGRNPHILYLGYDD